MKRLIIFLLLSLILIGCVFADSNKYWGRIQGTEKTLYHSTQDWAYSSKGSDDWVYGADNPDIDITVYIAGIAGDGDAPFIAFSYSKIEGIEGAPIMTIIGDDLLENFDDCISMRINPASDNTFCSTTSDYKMVLDEFRWCINQKMVNIIFSDGSFLLFNVNCANLYKYYKD